MTRRVFDLLEEPRGDVLRELLRAATRSATSAMLILRDDLGLGDAGQALLDRLEPHRLETRRASAWPGTELLGSQATLARFALTPPVLEALLDATDALYGWRQPELPEDLALVRADGTVWLASTAHERDAFLELTAEEYDDLVGAMPELAMLVRSYGIRPHRVGIVVDPEFGEQILPLARQLHLWVVHSVANTPAIRDFWAQEASSAVSDDALDTGVTSFETLAAESPEETCSRILETVDAHHGEWSHEPPWSEIEVFGSSLSPRLREAFEEFGAEEFLPTPSGFIARRPGT